MRVSLTMLLPAIPLALWGGWAIWASLHGYHWITAGLGGIALLTAGGLVALKIWAKYLAYLFAAGLALSWVYGVWQVAAHGWPYSDALHTAVSLIPGAFLLLLCAGGSYVVHRQYRGRET
jgi:hypothetical protein